MYLPPSQLHRSWTQVWLVLVARIKSLDFICFCNIHCRLSSSDCLDSFTRDLNLSPDLMEGVEEASQLISPSSRHLCFVSIQSSPPFVHTLDHSLILLPNFP